MTVMRSKLELTSASTTGNTADGVTFWGTDMQKWRFKSGTAGSPP
jgi:hypothetical protein